MQQRLCTLTIAISPCLILLFFSDHSLVPASYYGRLNLDKVFCDFFGSLQLQRQHENIEGKERL
jgi:hypothetical protein